MIYIPILGDATVTANVAFVLVAITLTILLFAIVSMGSMSGEYK